MEVPSSLTDTPTACSIPVGRMDPHSAFARIDYPNHGYAELEIIEDPLVCLRNGIAC